MLHKFSDRDDGQKLPDGKGVLAVTHFGKVVALIAERGAGHTEAQARALINARSQVEAYRDSYEIERVRVPVITIQSDKPRRFVAEVTARNETEAREKLAADDIEIKERG